MSAKDAGQNGQGYSLDGLPEQGWEMFTPEMAELALQNLRRNRKLRQARVDAIARDITNGEWHPNGETVKQGADGKWDDGQHRFHAIRQASIAVPLLVVRGIEEKSRVSIDSGMMRSYAQQLTMRGIRDGTNVAAITRRMMQWDQGIYMADVVKAPSYSRDEMDTYRLAHEKEIMAAAELRAHAYECWMSPAVLGSVHIILRRVDKEDAAQFLEQVISGAELTVSSPAYQLRKKLRVMSADELNTKGRDSEEKRAWVFTAWNHFRNGQQIGKLQAPRGRVFTQKNYPIPT